MPAVPIVAFPGVMGSRLYFPEADRFWDPDSTRRMLWWAPVWPVRSDDDNRRAMHVARPAGVVIDPLGDEFGPAEADRGWGGVVWSFYGELLRDLTAAFPGRPVYAVGYDWRQDIGSLGAFAADRVRRVLQLEQAGQVSIVTHSMGGLVVRAAFRADPTLRAAVARVVHVCQPTVGAVILYRRLFTGLLRPHDGGRGVSDRAFRLILGNTRAAFLGNMSGMPGPMQLLPSEHFPADAADAWNEFLGGTPFAELYVGPDRPPAIGATGLAAEIADDLAARVAEVGAFHAWLGAPTDPAFAHPETWLLYGADSPTETRITFPNGRPTPVTTPAGDEVVPAVSATALGLPPGRAIAFTGLKHAEACQAAVVRQVVKEILA